MSGLLDAAIKLAASGWRILPCVPTGSRAKQPIGSLVPHGYNDATTDSVTITDWWTRCRTALIGVRCDDTLCLDFDPRHDGTAEAFQAALNVTLPDTLTCWSGRGDGGHHRYYLRPTFDISQKLLPPGVDLKQAGKGYTIAPPSPHPETGRPYWWEVRPIAKLPDALIDALRPTPPVAARRVQPRRAFRSTSASVADVYSATASWHDVLDPHGWTCIDNDGDTDGARWRHPTAASAVSATVKHGCLFVYSPNTPLPITYPGDPAGVTRFRGYAILNHRGDMSTAAKALRGAA